MDRILESYLKDFIQEFNFEFLEQTEAFEFFVNYTILSKIHADTFDIEEISVGGGNDTAIDGVAIIVNDHIVNSIDEINHFKKQLRRFDVRFIFIQSKTSEKFDMGSIGNFLFGVQNFFEDTTSIVTNEKIQDLRMLKEYIYDQSIDMDKVPTCEMYYVTSGTWVGDKNLDGRIRGGINQLKLTKLFSEVKCTPVDAEFLKKLYRELRNKVVTQINFEKHSSMPAINGVHQAYLGILPVNEYLKLILDDGGDLQRNLFYDNVRDYQGNNPVNLEIESTIRDSNHSDRFGLLNNGITVVAKSITQVGSTFTIRDYQVVNGCQTSHVLFLNKDAISNNVFIPLKLIVTDDPDVTNQIIKATNRQTAVQIEAFVSLQPFQKQLEELYNSFKTQKPLYYERRSKQYEGFPIPKEQVISVAAQIKSFLAMFLNEPHSTHRYYGELLKANEGKIFSEGHNLFPYYISGYALYLVQKFFQSKDLPTEHKAFKHHMLMLFRLLTEKQRLPYLNSKKIEGYCSNLKDILWNEKDALTTFQRSAEIIESAMLTSSYSRYESARRKAFTMQLISLVSSEDIAATVKREQGTVKFYSDTKGYGFIYGPEGEEIFVHYTAIKDNNYLLMTPGTPVEYVLVQTDRGLNATDVEIIS